MLERRTLLVAPLAAAGLAGVGFWAVLRRMRSGTFDPRGVPTMLMDQRVPGFELPGLGGRPGIGSLDLADGQPVVLNFWASWCPPCVEEHPVLVGLSKQGVRLWGIAYKDSDTNAQAFLARRGNPFARVARDDPGRVAIDWGVTGVPETFIIDGAGVVRWHISGPMTAQSVADQLLPALRGLRRA